MYVLRDGDLIICIVEGLFKCMIYLVKYLDFEICIYMVNCIKLVFESLVLIEGNSMWVMVLVGFCISG